MLSPLEGAESYLPSPAVRVPGFRFRSEVGGFPHWRAPLLESLTSGQSSLSFNFNLFSGPHGHCDLFKPEDAKGEHPPYDSLQLGGGHGKKKKKKRRHRTILQGGAVFCQNTSL
ncbi:hypothetical protein ACOMHN_051964 [Nucella lapillus]